MTQSRHLLHIDELELHPRPEAYAPKGAAAERFDARVGFIGPLLGAQKLGYNLTVVPPGKRAYPFHTHVANEEMFFVLSGSGEVRIGSETFPIRQGHVIACPCGGPETAHQIINTGTEELRYLAISTRISPEISEYPDTGRFGILANMAPNADGTPRMLMFVGSEDQSLDYWEGQ
jgi:uncharacterized cupin superfamily protein